MYLSYIFIYIYNIYLQLDYLKNVVSLNKILTFEGFILSERNSKASMKMKKTL